MEATSEHTDPDKTHRKEYVNDNNWLSESLDVPKEKASIFISGQNGGDILVLALKTSTILKKVVLLPNTKPGWNPKSNPNVKLIEIYVSEEKPDLDFDKNDRETLVKCGTFYQMTKPDEILPITLSCEKCMPYGKYVIVRLGLDDDHMRITEIALYGHEIEL